MLFTLTDIADYHLNAVDGKIGEIHSFLIDTFDWAVRYLVLEVEDNHYVLLSAPTIGAPDANTKTLPVYVDRQFIMNGPTFDINQPLSRDIERRFSDYYQWPYYWEPDDVPNTLPGDLTAIPLIDMEVDREQKEDEQELIPATGPEDTQERGFYLHSTRELFGDTIHTTNDDHKAGKLVDIVTQDEDWNVLYLVVDTGGLLSGKKVLVSPNWVQQVDEMDSRIDVNLKQETIQNSPEFHSALDLTSDYQSRLNDYYQG